MLLFFISATFSTVFRVFFFLMPVRLMSLDPRKHQKRLRFGVPDYAPEPDLAEPAELELAEPTESVEPEESEPVEPVDPAETGSFITVPPLSSVTELVV